jgi:hypothetical protein
VGDLARASPRACGGGASDAGGWLCDAATSNARHRGLVIERLPPCSRWHRDASGAGAGAGERAASSVQRGPGRAALWQEFRGHGTSLNNMLNEALRIHVGHAWRVFQVRVFSVGFWSPPSRLFRACASSDSVSPLPCPPVTRVGGPSSGQALPPRPTELRA